MKKTLIIGLLGSLALCSCGEKYTYGQIVRYLANEGNVTLYSDSKNYYTYRDYFTSTFNDEVIIYITSTCKSRMYVYNELVNEFYQFTLKIPFAEEAPSVFDCTYKIDYESSTIMHQYYVFQVSNQITNEFIPHFENYTGDTSARIEKQREAAKFLETAIAELDTYLAQKYTISLKDIGMFPKY